MKSAGSFASATTLTSDDGKEVDHPVKKRKIGTYYQQLALQW
jgi:hypothetical protein